RLRRNEPVSNDNCSGHKPSTPLLQFNDIAFRISRVDDAEHTNTVYFCCRRLSHGVAAGDHNSLQSLIYIIDGKCNVSEPALVCGWEVRFDQLVIAENLERRTILIVARHSHMNTSKMCVPNPGYLIQP